MAGIAIRDVRKTFAGTEVLKSISIDVADGELLVILGPSGCGKSTLLRCVAGLETVTSGEVSIGGRVVNDLEPMDRDVAMVFQNYALYPHMSVRGNMAYGLKNRGTPAPEIERRVNEAAGILGLEGMLDRRPRQLSGGQRQRVAMGRAIVREPEAFLFDEPLSNLDAKLRGQMRVEIKRLQTRLSTTSLYVTHDQVEAMTLGDRLMVLRAGEVEQIGTPLDVYREPASLFVAGFIGQPGMNVLPAVVGEGGASVRLGEQSLPLSSRTQVRPGDDIRLGIRPEHLRLAADGARPGAAALRAKAELVELLGADLVVHVALDGLGEPLLARLPGEAGVKAGEALVLEVDPEDLHLFDASSGRRIARDGLGSSDTG